MAGCCECAAKKAADVYVSPSGNDAADGSLRAPLASAKGALEHVRKLRAAGKLPMSETVKVCFLKGRYPLVEPLSIDQEDSCLELCAESDGEAVFTGGRELPPFEDAGNGLWKVTVPKGFTFEQLWVGGARATRAKTPNEFYLYMKAPIDEIVDPETGMKVSGSNRAFFAYPRDLGALAGLSATELRRVVIRHYHSWEVTQGRLLSVDTKNGLVIETPSCWWGLFTWPQNEPRYVLENYKAALDAPGEWFLDVDASMLWYMPRNGETLAGTRAVAPVVNRFLTIHGDGKAGRPVRNVSLRGLNFEYAGYWMPAKGQFSRQAVTDVHSTISIADSENVALLNCRISHIAPHGVHFDSGSRRCRMAFCAVKDIGGSAVRVGEQLGAGDQRKGDSVEFISVEDNILQSGGRNFPGAVGVWICKASNVAVRHNDIGDFLYSGISMGWTWGYADTEVHDNDISYNHIHHIAQGVLSDAGGIYTLGKAPRTTITGNRIHDVYSYDYTGRGGWGLYADEGSAEMLFESNLVYRTKTGCVHQHYGKNNVFRNNIFAYSMCNMIQRSRMEDHRTFTFENNIVLWDNDTEAVHGGKKAPAKADDFVFARNVYWNTKGVYDKAFLGGSFAEWQRNGQDKGSVVADPLFVDPENGDFTLKPGSPAFALGFKAFDWASAGVRGPSEWKAEAAECDPGNVRFAPKPKPLKMDFPKLANDFELLGANGGKSPKLFAFSVGAGKGAHIKVTDSTSHGGRYSLELKDSPSLSQRYEPHLFKYVTADNGRATISFAIRCGKGSDVKMFLRYYSKEDPVNPYGFEQGPAIRFCDGKAFIGGKSCDAPCGRWLVVEMKLDFDRRKWTASLSHDGGNPTAAGSFDFPAKFKRLDWIGFTTDSANDSVWHLDDFVYTRD